LTTFDIHGRGFVVFLASLTALPPLAIDMALPSLALVEADFGASQTMAAASIAIFLAGFSTAPLLVGPLADRFGRKPVMIVGLCLFALCGLGCAAASSIGMLLTLRMVQGAGAGAVGILPRAIVRDLFDVRESRLFITAMAQVNGVAPVIAPSLGALILYVAPWRAIYLALAAFGVLLLGLGLARFRESQPGDARQSLKPAAVASNYWRALTNRFCLGFSLVLGLAFGGMFSFINASPLLFMQGFGVSKAAFAGLFAFTSLGVIGGASMNNWLVRRGVKPKTALDGALSLTVVAALALFVASLAGLASLAVVALLSFAYFLAMGLIFPNAMHEAVHPLPEIAGMASAILLSCQMLIGALGGTLGAAFFQDASIPGVAGVMTCAAATAAALYALWLRPLVEA
jgi:DHA1 family bicyclomycin/chloramphenicol resistance-like MFS transporter